MANRDLNTYLNLCAQSLTREPWDALLLSWRPLWRARGETIATSVKIRESRPRRQHFWIILLPRRSSVVCKTYRFLQKPWVFTTVFPASLQTVNNSLKSVEGLDQSTARVCMPALEQCFQTSESIEKTISAEWTPCLPGELFMWTFLTLFFIYILFRVHESFYGSQVNSVSRDDMFTGSAGLHLAQQRYAHLNTTTWLRQ